MSWEILIDGGPGETRVVLMEDGRTVQVALRRDHQGGPRLGDIFLARCGKTPSGAGGSFIKLGCGEGYLPLKGNAGRKVSEGAPLLLQVTREAEPGKAARLDRRLSLSGRLLELTDKRRGVQVARRLSGGRLCGGQRREDLLAAVSAWAEPDEGWLVHPAAAYAEPEALAAEAQALRQQRAALRHVDTSAKPPCLLLAAPDAVARLLQTAPPEIERIGIDGNALTETMAAEVERWAPDLVPHLTLWDQPEPLFSATGVDEQLDAALQPVVPLPGGGRLIIQTTAALVALDVDSGGHHDGQRTIDAVNTEAVIEAAHQIRLRNLSGQLVIDVIAQKDRGAQRRLLDKLRARVDEATHVLGFSGLGLIELTRERRTPPLAEILLGPCPTCGGNSGPSAETTALAALRQVVRRRGPRPTVIAHPSVLAALAGPLQAAQRQAEQRLGTALIVNADATLPPATFETEWT